MSETADFALKLVIQSAGKKKPVSNLSEHNKKVLALDPKFRAAFDSAKKRIRKMDFRFVEESDANERALLEVYCSLALKTKYNDFDAHQMTS